MGETWRCTCLVSLEFLSYVRFNFIHRKGLSGEDEDVRVKRGY